MDVDEFWFSWNAPAGRRISRSSGSDNLADLPAVRALAGQPQRQRAEEDWPTREELAYVAPRVHDHLTGQEDSICRVLAERGDRNPSDPAPLTLPGPSAVLWRSGIVCPGSRGCSRAGSAAGWEAAGSYAGSVSSEDREATVRS